VTLPFDIQTKYQSTKYKKKPLKRFSDRKQFALNWWKFKDRLCRDLDSTYEPNLPSDELIHLLRRLFASLVLPHKDLRHSRNCDGIKCRNYGCRYAFPNIYIVIKWLMFVFDYKSYKKHKDDFPDLSSKVMNSYRKMWSRYMGYLKWPENVKRFVVSPNPYIKYS
jgi:hypothetical protein